jgi:hypothetical protein
VSGAGNGHFATSGNEPGGTWTWDDAWAKRGPPMRLHRSLIAIALLLGAVSVSSRDNKCDDPLASDDWPKSMRLARRGDPR